MITRALMLILALSLVSPAYAAAPLPPDFSWIFKCPVSVRAIAQSARAKWIEASSLPSSPDCLRPKTRQAGFDEEYLRELIHRPDFGDISYNLLDTAMRKQQLLAESSDLYAKASAAAKVDASPERFRIAALYLSSTIRLATGISRAEIARQLMEPDDSSYCFQAMESAIDALRDSAADAQKIPGSEKRAESILKFRSTLFDTWENAQRTKDTKLIGAINLPRAFDDAFPKTAPLH